MRTYSKGAGTGKEEAGVWGSQVVKALLRPQELTSCGSGARLKFLRTPREPVRTCGLSSALTTWHTACAHILS